MTTPSPQSTTFFTSPLALISLKILRQGSDLHLKSPKNKNVANSLADRQFKKVCIKTPGVWCESMQQMWRDKESWAWKWSDYRNAPASKTSNRRSSCGPNLAGSSSNLSSVADAAVDNMHSMQYSNKHFPHFAGNYPSNYPCDNPCDNLAINAFQATISTILMTRTMLRRHGVKDLQK